MQLTNTKVRERSRAEFAVQPLAPLVHHIICGTADKARTHHMRRQSIDDGPQIERIRTSRTVQMTAAIERRMHKDHESTGSPIAFSFQSA